MSKPGFTSKLVMPGHSCPKDGVASARLCPGHPRLKTQEEDVDARHKAGHDGMSIDSTLRLPPRVSAAVGFGDGLARRPDVQHAPAIAENGSVFRRRAGVEDLDALDPG